MKLLVWRSSHFPVFFNACIILNFRKTKQYTYLEKLWEEHSSSCNDYIVCWFVLFGWLFIYIFNGFRFICFTFWADLNTSSFLEVSHKFKLVMVRSWKDCFLCIPSSMPLPLLKKDQSLWWNSWFWHLLFFASTIIFCPLRQNCLVHVLLTTVIYWCRHFNLQNNVAHQVYHHRCQ